MQTVSKPKHYIREYPSGIVFSKSYGFMQSNRTPIVRTKSTGWSHGSTIRLTTWLMSVDPGSVLGGDSITLTFSEMPDCDDYKRIKSALIKHIRERADRYTWVVEWQRRGVPHFHLFVDGMDGKRIVKWWLKRVDGVHEGAQDVKTVYAGGGWAKYTAKHGRRSVDNYQRKAGYMPKGWDNTGRMWGYGGAWVISEGVEQEVDENVWIECRERYAESVESAMHITLPDGAFTHGFRIWKDQAKGICGDLVPDIDFDVDVDYSRTFTEAEKRDLSYRLPTDQFARLLDESFEREFVDRKQIGSYAVNGVDSEAERKRLAADVASEIETAIAALDKYEPEPLSKRDYVPWSYRALGG